MKSIDILVKEHHLIIHFLGLLKQAQRMIERGEKPPLVFFENAVYFSKQYADQFHHFKEEYLMFGLLAQKEQGSLDREIGELRYQHERCRYCIAEIEKTVTTNSKLDEIRISHLLEHLSGYIALLNRHIFREDHIFFPLVARNLSNEDDAYLIEQFINQENSIGGQEFTSDIKKMIKQMAEFVL